VSHGAETDTDVSEQRDSVATSRRTILQRAASSLAILAASRNLCATAVAETGLDNAYASQRMGERVSVVPSKTERVTIKPAGWGESWGLIFPEVVFIGENASKYKFNDIAPEWKRTANGGWGYRWMPGAAYELFNSENPELELIVEIAPGTSELSLSITLLNHSEFAATQVSVDGGCFQAESPSFQCVEGNEKEEAGRTFLWEKGRMISLATLPRTIPERVSYHARPAEENKTERWRNAVYFWGKSDYSLDAPPGVIGMVCKDRKRAVAIAFEHSTTVSQNGDMAHHCLHSRPSWGTLQPKQSMTRNGLILFGSDIQKLGATARQRVEGGTGATRL